MRPILSIDDIFLQAVEFSDLRERESYLDSVCASDHDLRQQVEKLLAITPQLGSFLESPAHTPQSGRYLDSPTQATEATHRQRETTPNAESADLSGQNLGSYRLVRLAGKGGMGEVYLAEQQAPIHRKVAIKVIRHGLATKPMLARFAHESRLLGLMDHPNIARVLDAGTTENGYPFIAMEWVEGVFITTFCDQQRYTIRQRVELMVTVCQAIQHAHQKGVIHRDLKPSNVLAMVKEGQAVPKVIDFGVARATQGEEAEQDRVTQHGQIIGTFEYMAPEQAEVANADVDTRADVFALGAMLYELLTGEPPVSQDDLRKSNLSERLRWVREVEPMRPSQRYASLAELNFVAENRKTGVSQLPKLVANELDWICLKCLEKDRSRRYETTNALAQDLLRYLAAEPVQAGPPTLTYRFKKFAVRNRNLIAVALMLAVLLVSAASFSTWQAVRLGRLHEQSQANLEAANNNLDLAISAVDQFCTKVSEDLRLKEQDLRPLRRELLTSAVEFQQKLVQRRNQSDAALVDVARAHAKLGQLSMEIDSVEQAKASYRLAIGEYLALKKEQINPSIIPQNTELELANCYYHLALLLGRSNELETGIQILNQGLEILEQRLATEPASRATRTAMANARSAQATFALSTQKFEESENFARMAIEEFANLSREFPEDAFAFSNLANAQLQLGMGIFFRKMSRWREAEPLLLEALVAVRMAIRLDPHTSYHRLRLTNVLRALGQISKATGRREESLDYLAEALETLEQVRQKEPTVRSHAVLLSGVLIDFAHLHQMNKNSARQRESLEKALDILQPLIGDPQTEIDLAIVLSELAFVDLERDEFSDSEKKFDQAIRLAESALRRSPDNRQLSVSYPGMLEGRAKLRHGQGELEEALEDYGRALQVASAGFRSPYRIARGQIFLQLGSHHQAALEVQTAVAELPSDAPAFVWIDVLKKCAVLMARCSKVVDADQALSLEEQTLLAEKYAATAVRLLIQAIDKGFQDIESLVTVPEFELLHDRDDFQKLSK